ncbi:head protein [Candidatus Woesearchaeota archaeon]|nr:MAG: head protein [Candidatus Woesearchaeota archaeon]
MALPTNTQTTFATNGIREDLVNVIYDISPVETPFMSSIPKVKAKGTLHEWQTDSLASPSNNAQLEGDDAQADAASATTRLGNYTQISRKVARVSGTNRVVNSAGRSDELDYQVLKRGRELKRDIETALLANKAKSAGSAGVARELAGVPAWIATNTNFGGTGADPTGDGSDARTDGTQRAFAEADLKAVLGDIFDAGGQPDLILVGSFNKQQMSSFTGNATRFVDAKDKRLTAAIDVYVSDFGELSVIPNRFMRARDALILQTDMWAFATLRDFEEVPLAKTGDSDAVMIVTEYTLEARNEASSGGVFDLTTA